MNLTLKRNEFRADGIFGELLKDDGSRFCYTLEHAYAQPDGNYAPKVPEGTYTCVRGQHQLEHSPAPFTTFEVTNVPGHTNILIHKGNYNHDSDGCILIGMEVRQSVGTVGSDQILSRSAMAFNAFMNLQAGVDEFQLTVTNS